MSDPLPPDPYLALGVACDATPGAIKTQYRKLVLKHHPDKVQDESQKAIAADEFHKVQTAYEIIGDDSRRHRYDAQKRLTDLKREMLERSGGPTARHSPPNVSSQPPRPAEPRSRPVDMSQKFEEGRPSFATSQDFFDSPPRATARKDAEYERTSKRAAPRSDREKTRQSPRDLKETERSSRREKSRRTDRDIRRDREHKQPVYSSVEEDDAGNGNTSDEYERARERRRRDREEDEVRRAREAYHEQVRRQHEEAAHGVYADERARKLFSQADDAREYIERSSGRDSRRRGESARRSSPVRGAAASKEKVEYIVRSEGRPPIMIRRGSGRPKVPDVEPIPQLRRSNTRDREIVDEPRDFKVPGDFKVPALVPSKSSPADIRPPFDRQRSNSAQISANHEPLMPTMIRSQTMPVGQKESRGEPRRRDSNAPNKSSGLRGEPHTAYPTPEQSPEPAVRRYRYGQEYADDAEFPTPDGYRTGTHDTSGPSFREPVYNRSPERNSRERVSAAAAAPTAQPSATYPSAGRPSQPPRINTGTFLQGEPTRASPKSYAPDEQIYSASTGKPSYSRSSPAVSRENSGRGPLLYGEVSTASPSAGMPSSGTKHGASRATPHSSKFASAVPAASPSADVQYQPSFRREDVKIQTGYTSSAPRHSSSRHTSSRPEYYRASSGNAVRVR